MAQLRCNGPLPQLRCPAFCPVRLDSLDSAKNLDCHRVLVGGVAKTAIDQFAQPALRRQGGQEKCRDRNQRHDDHIARHQPNHQQEKRHKGQIPQ